MHDHSEISLADKYRPKCLAEIVGQGAVRERLEDFAAAPYSYAWLFAGGPGIGKSSCALALGNELGCHPTSGVWQYNGTDLDEDTMDGLQAELRFAPMGGGWRCIIIDEADYFVRCPKTYTRWNSILESRPTRTVFVFTTNAPEKFSTRFLRRVERLNFESENAVLAMDAQLLCDRIWRGEGQTGPAPRVASLPGIFGADGHAILSDVPMALDAILKRGPRLTLKPPTESPRSLWQAATDRKRDEPKPPRFTVGTPGRSAAMFT